MRIAVRQATRDDLDSIVQVLGELQMPPTAVADSDAWTAMLGQTGRTILIADRMATLLEQRIYGSPRRSCTEPSQGRS